MRPLLTSTIQCCFSTAVVRRISCFLFVLGMVVGPRQILGAQPSVKEDNTHRIQKSTVKPVTIKLRYVPPYNGLELHFNDDSNDSRSVVLNLVDGSLGFEWRNFLVAEVGGSYHFGNLLYGKSYGVFGRAGVMPLVLDARTAAHRGPTLQLGGMAGWRFSRHDSDHEIYYLQLLHAVTVTGALDYTHWSSQHFAVCFRLLLEAGVPFYQSASDDWQGDYGTTHGLLRLALSVGIAF